MINKIIYNNIKNIYDSGTEIKITPKDKFVIFSDLHMGDGNRNDDFERNSKLFSYVLKNYYLKNDYTLILNGDIEDLQRFKFQKICKKWQAVFEIFDSFSAKQNLYKLIGNHDEDLIFNKEYIEKYSLHESIKLVSQNIDIFIFHGHQASQKYMKHNKLIGLFLRYIANPLGIGNYSVSHDSRRKYFIEQNVYNFTRTKKIISIVGHTHRPLFESLSKIDTLKFKIEELCRNYYVSNNEKKKEIETIIHGYEKELESFSKKEKKKNLHDSIYGSDLVLPCLFNSGCVIGKRGITAIEIVNNEISLVHYFDKNISEKFLHTNNHPSQIDDTDFYKVVLNKDSLEYINTKIKILNSAF